MGIFELFSAIFLILSCIFIIIIVFFQGSQKGGMSQTITGQSSDNYYQRNMGRSKEVRLKRLTAVAAVLFFVVAIAVNVIAAHFPDGFGGEASVSQGEEAANGGEESANDGEEVANGDEEDANDGEEATNDEEEVANGNEEVANDSEE